MKRTVEIVCVERGTLNRMIYLEEHFRKGGGTNGIVVELCSVKRAKSVTKVPRIACCM
jgi:hypothetical protein